MGHSRIIGPNPMQTCATTGFEEGMAIADVDIKAEIMKARLASMAGSDLLKDRKPATYGELVKKNRRNPISVIWVNSKNSRCFGVEYERCAWRRKNSA